MAYKALLFGNAAFDLGAGLNPLEGPPNDLTALSGALIHPEVGLHRPEDVRAHLNHTHSEMLEHMARFFDASLPDDQLLLYYSGHGIRDPRNNLYLCARNTRIDSPIATAIMDTQVNTMIENSPCRRFVVILDCCYSGSFKGGDLPDTLRAGTGRFVLASCRRSELSNDAGKRGESSVFTRFLVDALLAADSDSDGDGFVTLSEVYNYMLPRMVGATKHVPQRSYDKTVGDVVLARARNRPAQVAQAAQAIAVASQAPAQAVQVPSTPPPVLDVSEAEVVLRDVELGEDLPAETIDVFDRNGGRLDWIAETGDDWITVTPKSGFVELKLAPRKVGVNRGVVHIRDRGHAGSRKVRVTVHVKQSERKALEVEPPALDLGTLSVGATAVRQTVRTRNAGKDLVATCDDPRVTVRVRGARRADGPSSSLLPDSGTDHYQLIDVAVAATVAGPTIDTSIHVTSAGGSAIIPVKATIEARPVMAVEPAALDFGEIARDDIAVGPGKRPRRRIAVRNTGAGALRWQCSIDSGTFFDITPVQDAVEVELRESSEGSYHGSIQFTGNGGNATVDVIAKVLPPRMDGPPTDTGIDANTWDRMVATAQHQLGTGPGFARPPLPVPGFPPGTWRIDISAYGLVASQMILQLFPNGVVAGHQQLMGYQVALQGRWLFDVANRHLVLEVYGAGMGDTIVIQIAGEQNGVLFGQDWKGVSYALTRMA